jgi:hypothetical protein
LASTACGSPSARTDAAAALEKYRTLSIAVLFDRHGERRAYFQQTGELAGNQEFKVIQGVRYGNIVVQFNLNRAASGIAILRSQSNIFASASQADFNHVAPYCRVR